MIIKERKQVPEIFWGVGTAIEKTKSTTGNFKYAFVDQYFDVTDLPINKNVYSNCFFFYFLIIKLFYSHKDRSVCGLKTSTIVIFWLPPKFAG